MNKEWETIWNCWTWSRCTSRARSQCQYRSYSWRKLAYQRRSRRRFRAISENPAKNKIEKAWGSEKNREIELESFWCTLERHSTDDESRHHNEGESRGDINRLAGGLGAPEDAQVADHPHDENSADDFPTHTTNVVYTRRVVHLKSPSLPKLKFRIGGSFICRA